MNSSSSTRYSAPDWWTLPSGPMVTHWLHQPALEAPCRLAIVYAHPDDETYSSGGTIARAVAAGITVHLIYATGGEGATVAPKLLGDQSITELRTAEFLCAATALGVQAVHLLGYRDSGMAGSPEAQHEAALVAAPQEELIDRIVALLRTFRPQVVVTHGPFGGYGHPDHIRVHEVTLATVAAAADATRFPDHQVHGLGPWAADRLYYQTFDPRPIRVFNRLLRAVGRDPRRFGTNRDVDLVAAGADRRPQGLEPAAPSARVPVRGAAA